MELYKLRNFDSSPVHLALVYLRVGSSMQLVPNSEARFSYTKEQIEYLAF